MRYIAIPDIQAPLHDPRAVAALVEYIAKTKPDGLLCVGDELDSPQPSRWVRGQAGEFANTLLQDINICHGIMADFRKALGKNKPFHVVQSNHGIRIAKYVETVAPALSPFIEPGGLLDIPMLLGYPELDITFHRKPVEFARGWMLAHGDEGSMSRIPGGTAKGLALKFGKSVVCGHTHSAGIIPHTTGRPPNQTTIYGVEVGNVMEMRKADYLKSGVADWQQAFGIIHVNEKDWRKTTPELRFIVKGEVTGGN